jgi:hypothetical protein
MKLLQCNKNDGHAPRIACSPAISPSKKLVPGLWKSLTQLGSAVGKRSIRDGMRKCCLHFLVLFCTCLSVSGKIKNGYEKDISVMKKSLSYLQTILIENKEISSLKRRKMEATVLTLVNHIAHYELTENLLNQFRIIAPQLYSQVDTISDRMGRPVDVYVKFVQAGATAVKAWGTTYVNQMENDQDAYLSEYGPFTVSVKIWIVANALLVLSHELGHVKHQVPNLASYLKFHRDHYKNNQQSTYIGHNANDLSGKSANQFAHIFKKDYASFLKTKNEKIPSPSALLAKIRKNLNNRDSMLSNSRKPIAYDEA